MHMVDFSYAGKRLSDCGCIITNLNTSDSDSVSLGSNLTFETLKNSSTYINRIVKVDYAEPITITFDICKNPCDGIMNFYNDNEISYIMRWLNKKSYEKFRPIYDDNSYSEIYFKGSFNVTAIYIGGKVIGFTLNFTSNSPFGYENERELDIKIDDNNNTFTFFNNSDEYGYLYPTKFVITCKSSGDFSMSNNIDNNIVTIKNCTNGEVITLDCYNKIIRSSLDRTTLSNDFNYSYPRFVVNENTNENVFTVSLPCEIAITYSFVRKAGVIV